MSVPPRHPLQGRHQKQTVLLSRSACWLSWCLRVPKKTPFCVSRVFVTLAHNATVQQTHPLLPVSSIYLYLIWPCWGLHSDQTKAQRTRRTTEHKSGPPAAVKWAMCGMGGFLDVFYTTALPSFSSGICAARNSLRTACLSLKVKRLLWYGD